MPLTTILDLLGLLLIVAGIAILVSFWLVPAGIVAAGAGILGVSWLIDSRRGRK